MLARVALSTLRGLQSLALHAPGLFVHLRLRILRANRVGTGVGPRLAFPSTRDRFRENFQTGSLTGAVHLSKGNAGVQSAAQRGQKPRVEQKGKSCVDPDSQYEYGRRKPGLSILLSVRSFKQEVSEKLPQG